MACNDPCCGVPASGDENKLNGCSHCISCNVGPVLSAFHGSADLVRFADSEPAYPRLLLARLAAAPRDGPEHPPKA
jgi:hypothetical protein